MISDTPKLTLDYLKEITPRNKRGLLTQELVDSLNDISNDVTTTEAIKSNFIQYSHILSEGRYSLVEYANAVKYCSFKLLGHNDTDAWVKTFPSRYQELQSTNKESFAGQYANIYKSTKLVVKIMEQSMIPVHILNAPMYQETLNQLFALVRDGKTPPMPRVKAGEAILKALQPPETSKMQLDVKIAPNDTMTDIASSLKDLVAAQNKALDLGVPLSSIASSKLMIDTTAEESKEEREG